MIFLYRVLQIFLFPIALVWALVRVGQGKETFVTLAYRFGVWGVRVKKNVPRVWVHGASVGEMVSVLPLVHHLRHLQPNVQLVLTSHTRTSAKLIRREIAAQGWQEWVLHQPVPYDFWLCVKLFFMRVRPAVSVMVESELWPELVVQAPHPLLLLNARVGKKSVKKRARWGAIYRHMLKQVDVCWAQSTLDKLNLEKLGATHVECKGNLKFDAPVLPANLQAVQAWQPLLKLRKVVVFASVHAEEMDEVITLIQTLRPRVPDMLSVIVPRHPPKAAGMEKALLAATLNVHRRSTQEGLPLPDVDVYLADTLGELGLWYRLAQAVVMGGTLKPIGGHNVLEPMKLNAVVLTGEHMHNFPDMLAVLLPVGGLLMCPSLEGLAHNLYNVLTDEQFANTQRMRQQRAIEKISGASLAAAELIRDKLKV